MANFSRNYARMSDGELLQLLETNDEKAFRIIYSRYAELLFHTAFKRLPIAHKAEDLVQEIFIQLYRNRNSLSEINDLRAWLLGCLRNKILSEMRNLKIHEKHHQQLAHEQPQNSIDFVGYDVKVLEANFHLALTQLTERCRQVFTLSRIEKLPNKTIAQQLNLSVKAVEKHITTALRVLRKEIGLN